MSEKIRLGVSQCLMGDNVRYDGQHYVRKFKVGYLAEQCYFHPHPLELKLRNHA